ncbi:MAG: AMP-binding protein, partial [Bacteroidota bacterium]
MQFPTLLHAFYHHEKNRADLPYLRQPFGDRWEEYTWAEVGQMARKLAAYFHSLHLPPGSHIGLVSKNCREWIIADLGIMMAGHVSVPFFATLT